MKTIKYLAYPLCFVLLASCSDSKLTPDSQQPQSPEGKTVLTASILEPKTSLGDKTGSIYAVKWTEGDQICVNGVTSSKSGISAEDGSATFEFDAALDAPYKAVYPAAAYKSEGVVTIPSSQTYAAGNFDAASAVMCGVAESGTELTFHHLMAYLKLTFNTVSDPDAIRSVTVKSRGSESMSGDFNLDYETLALTAADGAKTVTVDCGEGVALGTAVVVAVPAQNYGSGLEITTTDVNGDKTVHTLKSAFDAKAGKVYDMNITFELYPGSRLKPVKVNDILWAPVYCGYSPEHPNGLLYQYGRAAGQPYYPAATTSAIVKAGPVAEPEDGYFYSNNGGDWYGGTSLNSWPMSKSDEGYVEGKIGNPCPKGWRVPTVSELEELVTIGFTQSSDWAFGYSDKWTAAQQEASVVKAGFTLKGDSGLFFAAVGGRTGAGKSFYRSNEEAYARLWASDRNNSNGKYASCLAIQRKANMTGPDEFTIVIRTNYAKSGGISVRCVKSAK